MKLWLPIALSLIVAGTTASHCALGQDTSHRAAITVSAASLRVPQKARKHYNQAREAALHNLKEVCMAELQKALEIDADFADVYLLRAIQETGAHQYEAALADATTAVAKDPVISWARIVMAEAYNGMGRYREANQILLNLRGQDADAWQAKFEMTRSAIGRGDIEAALRMSEITLKVVPERRIDVHLLRANALQMAHRREEAMVQLELYLGSSEPQPQRAVVLATLEDTRKIAAREDTEIAASK